MGLPRTLAYVLYCHIKLAFLLTPYLFGFHPRVCLDLIPGYVWISSPGMFGSHPRLCSDLIPSYVWISSPGMFGSHPRVCLDFIPWYVWISSPGMFGSHPRVCLQLDAFVPVPRSNSLLILCFVYPFVTNLKKNKAESASVQSTR